MSGIFLYRPEAQQAPPPMDYRNSPYLGAFYGQTISPFIPPMTLGGNSPFSPQASLPPSPNVYPSPLPGAYTPFVAFPGPDPSSPYVPAWHRERRLSWNGAPPASPYQQDGTWVRPPPERKRTRSFGPSPYQSPAPIHSTFLSPNPAYSLYAPPIEQSIHPYLNGENPRADMIFNLSQPDFNPQRYAGNNQTWSLSMDDLFQSAFHPPIYKMTIYCDVPLPDWPINMDFRSNQPYNANVPSIKLGDILSAIYYQFQKRISQDDWAMLSPQHEHAVAQAYTRRCRALGPSELAMRNQGVKQVDFLLGKVWFKGLVRTGDSFEHMKVILG